VIRPGIKRLFTLALRRRNAARDVDRELATHLEFRTEQLVHRGWNREDAWAEAVRRLGALDHTARTLGSHAARRDRRMQLRESIADLLADVRHSVRSLAREPGVSLFAITALALGVGANATMFGIVDRLMLRPPAHIRDAHAVGRLQITSQRPGFNEARSGTFGYVLYDNIRRSAATVSAAATFAASEVVVFGKGRNSRTINGAEATWTLFPLLGVQPELGRFFDAKEDDPVSPLPVAVLGYGFWQSEFGGARDVIGRTALISGESYTIIGVAPKGFTGPGLMRIDVWTPESYGSHSSNWTTTWNARWLNVVLRVKDGVTFDQAGAELTALYKRLRNIPDTSPLRLSAAIRPVTTQRDGTQMSEARVSKWLFGVSLIVLVVASANVVNLLLARTVRRRREIAVRLTLGAGRARLIRLLVTESMVLAGVAGAAGVAVAWIMGGVTRGLLIPNVEWTSGVADLRVAVISGGIALLAGLIVGLVPALQASAPDLTSALKAGVREGGGRTQRIRATLTIAQAALSFALLVGAGLFIESLRRVQALDLGVETNRVLRIWVQQEGANDESFATMRQRQSHLYGTALERFRERPDVESASLAIGLSFGMTFGDAIRVPGMDSIPQLKGGGPYMSAVTPGFFETVGTRIARGRPFQSEDRAGSAPVAIINETMAETLWPNENPIGRCFYVGQSKNCATIVGIAVDARRGQLREEKALMFYIPYGQEEGIGGTSLVVRPRGNARQMIADARRMLFDMDPSITFVNIAAMQDAVDAQTRPWRLGAMMFTLMGVLAFVVAAIGMYSVIAYFVANRRHEIGVRIALGAQARDIVRLIVGNGLVLAVIGVAAGSAIALAAARLIQPLLFETPARNPAVFVTVAVALLAVAFVATVIPALRARRVNPVDAMRVD
jgi:predicted permease